MRSATAPSEPAVRSEPAAEDRREWSGRAPGPRYELKDWPGSSHALLARWLQDLPPGARVLELGAGDAQVARAARRADVYWLGLESDLGCLGSFKGILAGGAIVDLERLDSLPAGFDAIIAADVLEHLNDPGRALRLIHRALRPGGRLFVSVPNIAHLWVRLGLAFGRFSYGDRGILDRTHRVFFTRHSLRGALAATGFTIEREGASIVPLRLAFPRLPRLLTRTAELVQRAAVRLRPTLLGYQLLAGARRV